MRCQVDYFNNKIICDLVEASHSGILAQLDEACYMVGRVDDKMFLDSLSTKLASHKHFTSRKVKWLHYVHGLAARWRDGQDVGLVIARSWVQLPVRSLSSGYYLDG